MYTSIIGILVFFPFLAGIACFAVGKKNEAYRDYLADASVILEFVLMLVLFGHFGKLAASQKDVWDCAAAGLKIKEICGFGLSFELDGFRLIYGTVASFMWMMCTILSREYFAHHENRNSFYLFLLLTLGATMGVFLSADLFTTFIFFEIMSFTSYVWVAQEENQGALKAAGTYLAVAVIGGLVMLMGIFLR